MTDYALPSNARVAKVVSKSSAFETIKRYLYGNFDAFEASGTAYKGEVNIYITGHDSAGFTLDALIERLASGLHTTVEVVADDNVPAIRVGEDVFAVRDEITGNLLEELDVSEQCDGCGKNHIVAVDPLRALVLGHQYECAECFFQYPIFVTIAERAVFA